MGKPAENFYTIIMYAKEFSETTREALKNIDSKFLNWFIGFSEGDGCFHITNRNYLEFKITQSSHDAQVLFFIKKNLGFGSVSVQDKKNKTHHYRVRNQEGLYRIICIFNGKLYLQKRKEQFQKWLLAYNTLYKSNIEYIENIEKVSLSSSWLSGFIDAEGCFTISFILRSPSYTQVQMRFILSQQGEYLLFSFLASLLDGRVSFLKTYNGFNLTVNLQNLDKIIFYLKKFPLHSKKNVVFLKWLRIRNRVLKKEHLTKEGLEKIRKLAENLNQ